MSTLHAWLEFTDQQTGSPRRVDLDENTLSIGKTGGDLRLVDPALSELHAILTRERESFVIRDLGSGAGTFVNERPVVEAQLTNLDQIRLGQTILVFHAAYLTAEAFARRHGHSELAAPGRSEDTQALGPRARGPLISLSMFIHPHRFWPQALSTGVFAIRRTWLTHVLNASILTAGAFLSSSGIPLVHLGFLSFAALMALSLMAITCSVFFAFDSLSDAPHRLSQALRFVFHVAPFVLAVQVAFLTWAGRLHPHGDRFIVAAMLPTAAFCAIVGSQSRLAFGSGLARGLAFAITASVPWNLLLTGLMWFIIS